MTDITMDGLRPCSSFTQTLLDTTGAIKSRLIKLEKPLADTLNVTGRVLGNVAQLMLPLTALVVPLAVFQQ